MPESGRGAVRASTLLKAPKAVGCARNGDHVVRVVVLRGVVSTIGFELATLGLTYAVVTSIALLGLTVSDVQ